jgi:class 3 adenylate cyclase
MENAARTQRDLRWRILGFGAVALLAALAISPLLIHGLYRPIGDVVKGTTEIRRGNFAVQVPVRSRDQIGGLAKAFNEMAKDLALKEKYHNVLNMVADKDVAAQLMSGEVNLGGEVRQVSILFCDIRDFTPLTEQMPPSEVIQLLNEHMTALTRVVYEHQGVVDKFVGDLIMAVFGAPVSYGNDVRNAANCALRMMEERQKLNVSSRHQVQIGIGIASGQVLAGCMGSKDRLNYTVLGKRVNLASRLCGKAAAGQIIIDQTTHESLKEILRANPLPALELKGFAGAVSAYELIQIKAAPTQPMTASFEPRPS